MEGINTRGIAYEKKDSKKSRKLQREKAERLALESAKGEKHHRIPSGAGESIHVLIIH